MKKTYCLSGLFFLMMLTCTACSEEDELLSFYVQGLGMQQFTISKDKVIIKAVSETEVNTILKQDALRFPDSWNRIWVMAIINPKVTNLDDVLKMAGVADAAYALADVSGSIFYPTDQIAIQCKDGHLPESILSKAGLADNIKTIERMDPTADLYMITLDVKLRDIFKVCNDVFETKMCVFAEPVITSGYELDINFN